MSKSLLFPTQGRAFPGWAASNSVFIGSIAKMCGSATSSDRTIKHAPEIARRSVLVSFIEQTSDLSPRLRRDGKACCASEGTCAAAPRQHWLSKAHIVTSLSPFYNEGSHSARFGQDKLRALVSGIPICRKYAHRHLSLRGFSALCVLTLGAQGLDIKPGLYCFDCQEHQRWLQTPPGRHQQTQPFQRAHW